MYKKIFSSTRCPSGSTRGPRKFSITLPILSGFLAELVYKITSGVG
ncbi:Uncharacterized protein APZ42_014649 [Daphnia magna]|uniref:Uncharacterized protein n=1 Tax=Daphnia magna TaxID=35525 RepID=A0A162PST3_9CRUS|nr:Uncharacterized protein APZ42_014649 [Daphnia magna]